MRMRTFLISLNASAPVAFVGLWASGHFWWGLGILFIAHMLALVATLVPGCSWWGPVISGFAPGRDAVWLTIDDGPDPHDTPLILDHLARRGAKATFFVIGEKALRWPELITAIRDAGHGIENHTLSHPKFTFWRLGVRRLREEIEGGQRIISELGGGSPKFFRAPAGMRNLFVHRILREMGMDLLGWNVRGRDGVSVDRDAIVGRIVARLRPGAIVLMHEGMRDADGQSVIADTLPRVLDAVEACGCRLVIPCIGC